MSSRLTRSTSKAGGFMRCCTTSPRSVPTNSAAYAAGSTSLRISPARIPSSINFCTAIRNLRSACAISPRISRSGDRKSTRLNSSHSLHVVLPIWIDIAADLAGSHSFFDQLLHRHPKFTVRLRHLASNLPERTERLADQHVHRVAIARCGHAQTSLCRDDQRFHPMEPCQRGLQQFCELTLQALGHGAYQRALRSEPMAYEPVTVAGQLADFHQRRPAASLAFN